MSMASAETVVIHPSADAYVYPEKADKNYGNKTWLQVKSKMNENYHTFIKFDLSSIRFREFATQTPPFSVRHSSFFIPSPRP